MPITNDGKYRWYSIDSCWVDIVIFVPYMRKIRNVSEAEAIGQFYEAIRRGEGFKNAVRVTPTGTQMINMSPGDADAYHEILHDAWEKRIYTESHAIIHDEGWENPKKEVMTSEETPAASSSGA